MNIHELQLKLEFVELKRRVIEILYFTKCDSTYTSDDAIEDLQNLLQYLECMEPDLIS